MSESNVVAELERLDAVVRDVQMIVIADSTVVVRLGQIRDEVWELIEQIRRTNNEKEISDHGNSHER